jgi:hypothetical protein
LVFISGEVTLYVKRQFVPFGYDLLPPACWR